MYGIEYAKKAADLADPASSAHLSPRATQTRLEAAAVYAQLATAAAVAGRWERQPGSLVGS